MKKLFIISTIIVGTFASAGIASAADADVTVGSYTGWQLDAFTSGHNR